MFAGCQGQVVPRWISLYTTVWVRRQTTTTWSASNGSFERRISRLEKLETSDAWVKYGNLNSSEPSLLEEAIAFSVMPLFGNGIEACQNREILCASEGQKPKAIYENWTVIENSLFSNTGEVIGLTPLRRIEQTLNNVIQRILFMRQFATTL